MKTLPTVPGTIVTFDLPKDTDGTVYRAVATLIVGHIDETGEVHAAVWASATVDAPDDEGNVFSEADILNSSPQLLVTTAAATQKPESFREEGTVIRVLEHGDPMTYTFAPSFLYDDEFGDSFWTNSYGGYLAYLDEDECEVLFAPSHRA